MYDRTHYLFLVGSLMPFSGSKVSLEPSTAARASCIVMPVYWLSDSPPVLYHVPPSLRALRPTEGLQPCARAILACTSGLSDGQAFISHSNPTSTAVEQDEVLCSCWIALPARHQRGTCARLSRRLGEGGVGGVLQVSRTVLGGRALSARRQR